MPMENAITLSYKIHPLLHGLSARRCPMSPHCVSIQAIGTGSGILGFRPYWCPFLFPSSSVSGCFSIHSSSPAIEFHSCFILMTDVSVPIDRPFTYSLFRWVSSFGTGSGTRCCGPRGGAEVCMKQKSSNKFLPCTGFEPWTLQSDGRERYH